MMIENSVHVGHAQYLDSLFLKKMAPSLKQFKGFELARWIQLYELKLVTPLTKSISAMSTSLATKLYLTFV